MDVLTFRDQAVTVAAGTVMEITVSEVHEVYDDVGVVVVVSPMYMVLVRSNELPFPKGGGAAHEKIFMVLIILIAVIS